MKKNLFFVSTLVSMLAIMTLSACSKDESNENGNEEQSSLKLNKTESKIFLATKNVNDTLTAELTPKKDGDSFVWKTDNDQVATVDKNGVITGKSEGTTVVAVIARGLIKKCVVTVTDAIPVKDQALNDSLLEKGLDIDKNGRITAEEAKKFTGKIQFTNNKLITSLDGLEYFENITELNCQNTGIVAIDPSKFLKLEKLTCDRTDIKTLDVSKNLLLQTLNCENCSLLTASKEGTIHLDLTYNTALATFKGTGATQLAEVWGIGDQKPGWTLDPKTKYMKK